MIALSNEKNTHIDAISELTQDGQAPVEYLVVIHSDPVLVNRLSDALADKSAAILQLRQEDWDLEGDDLPEAIHWAYEICQVKRVILVGASSAYFPEREAILLGANGKSDSGRASLFDRVQHAEGVRQQAQDHYVSQLQALLEGREVSGLIANGELQVDGLFYRAESGVFTYYDDQTQSFSLLN